jgi:hypothetical protein
LKSLETLYFETVSGTLKEILELLMDKKELDRFVLVGGTSLSLQLGHRMSTDIDLFSDAEYGTLDFKAIEAMLCKSFAYVEPSSVDMVSLGKHYFIGNSITDLVKLDLYYTYAFVFETKVNSSVRMADMRDVAAMKLETIVNGGRKKDFWDLHELMNDYSIQDMIAFHERRYPYGHNRESIIQSLMSCSNADHDFDPICLKSKHWELIKLDIIENCERI